MTRKRYFLLLEALCFVVPYLIAGQLNSHNQALYVLIWTAKRFFFGVWLLALWAIMKEKYALSFFIAVGNIVSIIIGQLLGDALIKMSVSNVQVPTSAEQDAMLHLHWGWLIWFIAIAFFVIMGVVFEGRKNKRKHENNKVTN